MTTKELIDKAGYCRGEFQNSTGDLPQYITINKTHEIGLILLNQQLMGHPHAKMLCGMIISYSELLPIDNIIVSGHKLEIY